MKPRLSKGDRRRNATVLHLACVRCHFDELDLFVQSESFNLGRGHQHGSTGRSCNGQTSLSVESGLSTEGVASIIVALVALVIAVSQPCPTWPFKTRSNAFSLLTQNLSSTAVECMLACRRASFCHEPFRSTPIKVRMHTLLMRPGTAPGGAQSLSAANNDKDMIS
jgi:hypothetical protein